MSRLSDHLAIPPFGSGSHPSPPQHVAPTAPQFAAEVPLSRPLVTHEGEATVIRLKIPSYGDLIDLGEIDRVYVLEIDPVTNAPTRMETAVDRGTVMRWAERLSGYDRIVLGQLALGDGMKLEAALRRIVGAAQKGN